MAGVVSIATVLSILCGLFYVWAKWKLTYWQRRGVSTLPTNILFGNFKDSLFLRISPGYLLGRLYHQAKPDAKFIGFYIFHKPFFLLRDPKITKQMFVKDFNIFPNRYFAVKKGKDVISTQNLFSIDNPDWRYLRTKMSPVFSSGKVKALFNLMRESSESLAAYLHNMFEDNPRQLKTIDAKAVSSRYTTDVISSLSFGIRTNCFKESADFYKRSRTLFDTDVFSTFVLFCMFFFPRVVEYFDQQALLRAQTSYFRDIFWSSMRAREESKSERGDAIDNLLKLKNEPDDGNKFKFQDDRLVAQSGVLFVAGLETSSTTMAFALWELAKSPDIQERVRSEILGKLEDGGLTYENVQQMKYLMQIINETLRMYPPAPILDRVAEQDYQIPDSDLVLEKGTPVYVALPGIQMDPNYFENPTKFDPDRFSDDKKIEPCTYMPFGEGPRICIGMRVGLLQAAVGLIRILEHYRVSVNPAYEGRVSRRAIFSAPENGLHLYFEQLKA